MLIQKNTDDYAVPHGMPHFALHFVHLLFVMCHICILRLMLKMKDLACLVYVK